jgi:E3 ubiquitin-protein ligase RNF216
MIQCADAHLFCTDCVIQYVSTRLGERHHKFPCMDQDGCMAQFSDGELRRVLPEKLLELYERVRQRSDVEAAGLEGLEECPFCEYRVVFEQDADSAKLFYCQNEDCGKVSCRKCKKEVRMLEKNRRGQRLRQLNRTIFQKAVLK